ncbi:DUF916 domain-containing protein [Nocardioides sp. YIM 152588]|uniref:WxL protein peptidoglycan domain-containing protein n=1 Tax=Nocardioides sp. YIM 152588 TaxID=3158259 RepID=UPI0032E3A701
MTAPLRTFRVLAAAVLAATTLLGTTLLAPPAGATDNGAWSVTPTPPAEGAAAPRTYFVLEGDPGSKIKDKVRIQNWTKKPLTFKLYGADGYNTERDGFFALRGYEEEMVDLGSWIKPLTSQVTVYGKTQVDVPITIRIPRNASPGDHVGGVVAMDVAISSSGDEGIDVGIQRAVGSRMYVRVSGPAAPSLEVSDVRLDHDRGAWPWSGEGSGTVTYTVENTGNLRLSPTALITLTGLAGVADEVTVDQLVDLLPGQRATLSQPVAHVPSAGRVTAEVALTTDEGAGARADASAWLVPWIPLALLAAILLGALGWWLHRRRTAPDPLAGAEGAPVITVSAGR